ncbi:FMN-binding protein [Clostridium grantii]|uniref:Uncharacterized protein, contains FMN-binding domain n=1 Tax=Clostridium grantii DSM 8605 TaxID=1121316 RepID=A0A1M5XWF1_9CLOT|nr:FMN-binding protein [Clostridium grantii]SHI04151.1 Uncharacterized protein, contains FMN-binding domain [Clostridium grantii DSM 8605]
MNKKVLIVATLLLSIFLSSCSTLKSQSQTFYVDGTYEGKGNGYGRGLNVSVNIKDGEINDIVIVSHNEVGKQYYEQAFEEIPRAIIETQNIHVDSISGATNTSNGIKEAVGNALEEASK